MNNKAVSHVVGFVLTFAVISTISVTMTYTVSIIIDNRVKNAAMLEAQSIANYISDAIMDCVMVKQYFPNATYHRILNLPSTIVNYGYYVEITDSAIYVNTTDGQIRFSSNNYNVKELRYDVGVSGKVYSSTPKVKVYCNKTEYVYRFDFGPDSSLGENGYIKVSNIRNSEEWWNDNWPYRIPIYINNSEGEEIKGYQVRILLDPTMIDYSLTKSDGTDIRFIEDNKVLPYWIEKWSTQGVSILWVKTDLLAHSNKKIFMYFGYKSASKIESGINTFDFFDDFNNLDSGRWVAYHSENISVENGILNLSGPSTIVTNSARIENGILEAKLRADGQADLEANLFARANNKVNNYNKAYLFSSAKLSTFPDRNLDIIKDNSQILASAEYAANLMEANKWYILSCNLVENVSILVRYIYDTLEISNYAYCRDDSYDKGFFGICRVYNGSFYTLCDWIRIRKYIDPIPRIKIGSVESYNFGWQDTSVLHAVDNGLQNFLRRDFIYANQAFSFYIKNLEKGYYSVSFIVGDYLKDCEGIRIVAEGKVVKRNLGCSAGDYVEDWFSIYVTDGTLNLRFEDTEGEHYIPLNAIKLEKGIKGVKISRC